MENIVVLTGAGVSKAAGLPTYREPGGHWSDTTFQRMNTSSRYGMYLPTLVPRWWQMTQAAQEARPTLFHEEVALRGWPVVTQNVDGLHQRAGSKEALEVHGTLHTWRCLRCRKSFPAQPTCPSCGGGKVRPDMVLFGEDLKRGQATRKLLRAASLLLVVGTSGEVEPVASWAREAPRSVLVDPKPWGSFTKTYPLTADAWVEAGARLLP